MGSHNRPPEVRIGTCVRTDVPKHRIADLQELFRGMAKIEELGELRGDTVLARITVPDRSLLHSVLDHIDGRPVLNRDEHGQRIRQSHWPQSEQYDVVGQGGV